MEELDGLSLRGLIPHKSKGFGQVEDLLQVGGMQNVCASMEANKPTYESDALYLVLVLVFVVLGAGVLSVDAELF